MRRILTAVALGAALFAAAACSDTKANPSASASVGSSASAAATASAGASGGTDSKAVCDAVTQALTKFGASLIEKAQQSGAALSDPAKAKQFLADISTDYAELSSSVKAEAAKATDPKLKKALEDLTKAADTLQGALKDSDKLSKDPSKVQEVLVSPELRTATDSIHSICGA